MFYNFQSKHMPVNRTYLGNMLGRRSNHDKRNEVREKEGRRGLLLSSVNRVSVSPRLSYLKPHDGDTGSVATKKFILSPNLATTAMFSRAVMMSGALGAQLVKSSSNHKPQDGFKRHILASYQQQQRDKKCQSFSEYIQAIKLARDSTQLLNIRHASKESMRRLLPRHNSPEIGCKSILRDTAILYKKGPSLTSKSKLTFRKKAIFDSTKTVFTNVNN